VRKTLRLAEKSIEYLWRCVVCLSETSRVLRGDQTPPDNITCPRCYGQARLVK
jgi:hypothetical protein